MPCPPGARPLLAASQSGSSSARKVSHCLLPSCSQLVYMLHAPPAGTATETPLPASVLNAPAPTQLLTSGPALKASSRITACGPPAWKATGMSRPIAADGTISISTPSALATGATVDHKPAASSTEKTARIIPRIYPPSPLAVPAQCSEPHHQAVRKRLTAATPKDHRRQTSYLYSGC